MEMKVETLIYDRVRSIIPNKSSKTVFFASVSETGYEVFFYAFIDGQPVQCFELAEKDLLDENELDAIFADIVDIIKQSKVYHSDKNNIATIIIDKFGVNIDVEYMDRDARMYGIKKEWKQKMIL